MVPIRWCLLCICYFWWFCWCMGHTNAQMRKCTDSCSRQIDWSSNPLLLSLKLHTVIAQSFEVTVAADGSQLSSKRVLTLSRRYHHHKKQLRQSAMMAEVSSDAWVCPKCSYENQDYQRCMGPDYDTVRPGGQFNTSEFSLSTQPPSSGRRSTISVAMNHPAADTRRSKTPPLLNKSLRGAWKRQMLLPTLPRCLALIVTREREVVSLSNPHIALNRERKGGIVKFVVVGSETKQQTISGKKITKAKHG